MRHLTSERVNWPDKVRTFCKLRNRLPQERLKSRNSGVSKGAGRALGAAHLGLVKWGLPNRVPLTSLVAPNAAPIFQEAPLGLQREAKSHVGRSILRQTHVNATGCMWFPMSSPAHAGQGPSYDVGALNLFPRIHEFPDPLTRLSWSISFRGSLSRSKQACFMGILQQQERPRFNGGSLRRTAN